jgi:hypothetical protein
MEIIVLNTRGLIDLLKRREVRSFVRRLKVSLICIIKIRVKVDKAVKIKENRVQGWGFLHSYENHQLGRIWVCWNLEELKVNLISKNDQVISAEKEEMRCVQSFVYGANKGVERRPLWNHLFSVKSKMNGDLWLLAWGF